MAKRDFGFDAVRALAIAIVLFCHLYSKAFMHNLGFAWYLPLFGVDLFFGLSGFLIGGLLIQMLNEKTGIFSMRQARLFLMRRLLRTAPLYFVLLFINFGFDKYLFKTINVLHWQYLLWMQGLDYNKPVLALFGESWSLCIEEWFYFSFAVCFSLFTIFTKRWAFPSIFKILIFTILYIIVCTLIRLFFSNYIYSDINTTEYRLDAIGYGLLAAVIYRLPNLKIGTHWLVVMGLCFSITGILLFMYAAKNKHFYWASYSLTGIGVSLFMLFVKKDHFFFSKIPFRKGITFLSKISYSVYLWNFIVIELVNYFFAPFLNPLALFLLPLFFIILLSYITYRTIEMPFLKVRDKYFKTPNG